MHIFRFYLFWKFVHDVVHMQKRASDNFGPRNYPVPESHAIQIKNEWFDINGYHPALVELWAGADDSIIEQSLYVDVKLFR